jgi:hypothetical protein
MMPTSCPYGGVAGLDALVEGEGGEIYSDFWEVSL